MSQHLSFRYNQYKSISPKKQAAKIKIGKRQQN